MIPPLQDAINALQQRGCKPVKSGYGYQAYCPIHEADGQGHHPSLTIKAGDTVPVVVHCHAGCDGTAILKALGINGTPHTGKPRIVATYPFQDANGIDVFEKVRREPKDFRIRHQPINGAGWVWKKPPLPSYPLYRLPDVQTAKADGRPIYFVEGEKDADRLTGLGLVATTNFEGASEKAKKPKWRPEYSDQLSGAARVILIPDNDEPGQAHMRNIAHQLRGKVADLRWLDLPGLPTKGDVSDWLNQGHTVAELLALVEQSPVADSVITDPPSQASTGGEGIDSHACKTKFNHTPPTLPTFPLEIQLDIPTGIGGLSCISYIFRLPSSLEDTDSKGNPELIESKVAKILAECLKARFAFCRQAGCWYAFVETHWQIMNAPVIDEVVTRLLYEGAPSGFKARTLAAILSLLTKGLLPLPDMATADCRRIPFNNGLLDPVTRALTPITPDNALTWCLPYAYDSAADCPTIKAWLRQAVSAEDSEDSDNPDDLVEFLRAWLAALLTGRADLQVFLHLLGPGKTGKGTLIRLFAALIGALNATITNLRNLETNRFETAALYRKRLVAITDSGKYGGSIDVFKALTGQDPLRLERKHQQQGATFIFDGMVLIASNEPLQFNDYTGAVERRRLTVEFSRRVTDEERAAWDAQGGETAVLHREIPGLVNWALALSRDEVTDRIRNRPQQVSRANQEAMQHSNPVADWLIQQVIPDPHHSLMIGGCAEVTRTTATGSGESESRKIFEQADNHAYPNYRAWCVRFSRPPVSTRQFSGLILDIARTLGASVQKRRNSSGMYIKGLRLRTTSDGSRRFWGVHAGTVTDMQHDEGSSFQNSQTATNGYAGSAGSDGTPAKNYPLYTRERESASPLALRIVGTLQAAGPGGMTPDDLTRTVDSGKTGQALVTACINQLLLDGRIGRMNGRLIANPEARH